jgi:hypothetical protein
MGVGGEELQIDPDQLSEFCLLRAQCDYLRECYEHAQTKLKLLAATRPELQEAFVAINRKNESVKDFQEKKAALLDLQGRIADSLDIPRAEMESSWFIDTETGQLKRGE